ncbi:hypothetical protein BDB01DRAFT_718280 [Pilobolus umbonatus]|nr:hypothetical protein BDB01DRAFT_718280 [Pilobolus umbonatus]
MRRNDLRTGHTIRLLCRDKEGLDLHYLEKMGAEIHQVDYKDESQIKKVMENVRSVWLIPEHSQNRVKEAEILIKIAKKNQVQTFGLLSMVGVDQFYHKNEAEAEYKDYRSFCQLAQIEMHLLQEFDSTCACIIRTAPFNQFFYYMAPEIMNDNKICLPVKKDVKWNTVDLNDVIDAIFQLVVRHGERNATSKHIFCFTGVENLTTEKIVKEIGQGLDQGNLEYHEVKPEKMEEWLKKKREDKQFKKRPDNNNEFGGGRDGYWSIPLGKFLNGQKIELIMEYWCLVNRNKLDIVTHDLKDALQRQPNTLKEYFKVNRQQFKEFR